MAVLCSLTGAAAFTQHKLLTWFSVLSEFPQEVVNEALVDVGVNGGAFPRMADVYAACRRRVPKEYSAHGTGEEALKAGPVRVREIASKLGLKTMP